MFFFFFQAEDGIRDGTVTGVQTCALPIWSTDHGRTWGPMSYVSPGFPASGGDSAPMVIEPNGRIDVLYQGYHITDTTAYAMDPAYSYFTSRSEERRVGKEFRSRGMTAADR